MRVDFYISNNNHHWHMMRPVMLALREKGVEVRLVSLCEFRRMASPIGNLEALGLPYFILQGLKFGGADTSTGKKGLGGNKAPLRNFLRLLIWIILLRRSLIKANKLLPAMVVVPNDVAFPFDRICRWFSKKKIRFILFQEGIRFPLPNEVGLLNYGKNGAYRVFAWGEGSANYFRKLGKEVVIVGNPRYDDIVNRPYAEEVMLIKAKYIKEKYALLFASNPIDDQGFCTHEEKIGLFISFLKGILPLIAEGNLTVLLRLHPREDENAFTKALEDNHLLDKVTLVNEPPLFVLLKSVDACVILASTVGMESIMMGTPIGVMGLKNYGHVFDYVEAGAALPLDSRYIDIEQVRKLIIEGKHVLHSAMNSYVAYHLSSIGRSSTTAADKLLELLSTK